MIGIQNVCLLFLVALSIIRAQTLTTISNFNGSNGAYPQYSLLQGSDGSFYGTTLGGGPNPQCPSLNVHSCGTIFKVSPGGSLTTLYSFSGPDGQTPSAPLIQATDGNFYGTTSNGGANGHGVVFRVTPEGTLTVLHSFTLVDGGDPMGVIQAPNGNFYGMTYLGGANSSGTLFEITPSGTLTTMHNFDYSGIGQGVLLVATDGNLYGTTSDSFGTIFRFTLAGVYTTLYSFGADGISGGLVPIGSLVEGNDGNIYGIVSQGGSNSNGVIFQMTLGGTFTPLHSFDRLESPYPPTGFINAADRNLYGTTGFGYSGTATLFKVSPPGVVTTLYAFQNSPGGLLTQAMGGAFYGTTLWRRIHQRRFRIPAKSRHCTFNRPIEGGG